MKAFRAASLVFAIVAGIGLQSSTRGEGQFYFPVGVAYSKGATDAFEKVKDVKEMGIEFWHAKATALSIEVGYDSSTVSVQYASGYHVDDVTLGFTVGVSAVF